MFHLQSYYAQYYDNERQMFYSVLFNSTLLRNIWILNLKLHHCYLTGDAGGDSHLLHIHNLFLRNCTGYHLLLVQFYLACFVGHTA